MKRYFLTLLATAIVTLALNAQPSLPNQSEDIKIEFVGAENGVVFADSSQFDTTKLEFTLKNTSQEQVELIGFGTSPLVILPHEKTLAPGESTKGAFTVNLQLTRLPLHGPVIAAFRQNGKLKYASGQAIIAAKDAAVLLPTNINWGPHEELTPKVAKLIYAPNGVTLTKVPTDVKGLKIEIKGNEIEITPTSRADRPTGFPVKVGLSNGQEIDLFLGIAPTPVMQKDSPPN